MTSSNEQTVLTMTLREGGTETRARGREKDQGATPLIETDLTETGLIGTGLTETSPDEEETTNMATGIRKRSIGVQSQDTIVGVAHPLPMMIGIRESRSSL